jgi:hypothetical protein
VSSQRHEWFNNHWHIIDHGFSLLKVTVGPAISADEARRLARALLLAADYADKKEKP